MTTLCVVLLVLPLVGRQPSSEERRVIETTRLAMTAEQRVGTSEPPHLGRFFLGPELAHLRSVASGSGTSGLTGGADHLDVDTVLVLGDVATINGRARIWIRSAGAQEVAGLVDFHAVLVRTPDGWRVADYAAPFAPGEGP